MANRYAVATGNWSSTSTWDGTTTLPSAGDVVRANGFTVTINQDVTVADLRTDASSPAAAGGGFTCSSTRTINANVVAGTTDCLTCTGIAGVAVVVNGSVTGGSASGADGIVNSGAGTVTVVGDVIAGTLSGSVCCGINNASSGTINVTGTVTGGSASANGIANASSGTINITGNVNAGSSTFGGSTNPAGVVNSASGSVNITGNITGGTAASGTAASAVNNLSSGTVTITGNVTGGSLLSTAYGVLNNSTGSVVVNGTCTASAAPAIQSTNAAAYLALSGPFVDSAVGVRAVNSPKLAIQPASVLASTDWKHAQAASTVPNYNGYRYLYTAGTDIGNPTAANVRHGTTFGPSSELTGTLRVPDPAYVSLGVPTDATVGTLTASLNASDVRAAIGLASANLDTQLAAIAAKTTNLPAFPAAVGSEMTLTAAYDAAKTAATQASVDTKPTAAQIDTQLSGTHGAGAWGGGGVLTQQNIDDIASSTATQVASVVTGLAGSTSSEPIANGGLLRLKQGDSYVTADGRQRAISVSGISGDWSGGTAVLWLKGRTETDKEDIAAATLTQVDDTLTATFNILPTDFDAIPIGDNWKWEMKVTLGGTRLVTPIEGKLSVRPSIG